MTKRPKLLYNKEAIPFILNIFNQETTEDGYLYNKYTNKQTLYPDGEQVNVNTMAGLVLNKNSEPVFIKDNLHSIIDIVDNYLTF